MGLEPTATDLEGRHSNQLSYYPVRKGRNRTFARDRFPKGVNLRYLDPSEPTQTFLISPRN